ncbi:MAG: hypothetical protein QNK04_22790 [Myxococcota bacterium]|nr:hypothetical protein [Myxococcota bacterium]
MQGQDFAASLPGLDWLEIREQDLEEALARFKRDLALRSVRRQLLSDGLDGRTARALADAALSLQA